MRDQRFTFLCSSEEHQLLIDLAERLQRSQGDTIRYLIRLFSDEFLQEGIDGLGCSKDKLKNHE
jgi:hypothetical protein